MTNVLMSDSGVPEGAAGKAADSLVEMATECKQAAVRDVRPVAVRRPGLLVMPFDRRRRR